MHDASFTVHLQPTFHAIQFKKDNMQARQNVQTADKTVAQQRLSNATFQVKQD